MCGITGIMEYGWTNGRVDANDLLKMRETLHHRGPDGSGLHITEDRRVGLAHRRLSIVDIEGGAQPMFGSRGEVLVFNGEIYNYPQLRVDLENNGTEFATTCDTEVILHLYAAHGRECVQHLEGMFAFAIWDPNVEELFFARDRVGEKPLYWSCVDGRFIFGSEIKAILAHPSVRPEVNEDSIGPYLTNLVTSSPETLYKGIQKLPPGVSGICDSRGVRTDRYASLTGSRKFTDCPPDEAAGKVRGLLDRSVHDRLMSDVPVGVLLSGGLDSTAIVAMLRDQAAGLATFSVGFQGEVAIDERDEARRVARHFGTDHHEVAIGGDDARRFLTGLVHHQDEPLADPVCMPLNFVCELAAKNDVKVVMAGEGADELFWGYPGYSRVLSHRRALRALLASPSFLRKSASASVPKRSSPRLQELMEGIARGRPLPLHMPLGLTRRQRESMLGSKQPAYSGWSPNYAAEGATEDPMETLFWDTQEYEFDLRLPELLLMRIDRFSMANGVEARVPFLSPELVDFVYSLPLQHKWHDGTTKLILRESIGDLIPDWVMNRPKRGFGAPVEEWFAGDLQAIFEKLIETDSIKRYFDVEVVRSILNSEGSNGRQARWSLWSVFNFALWHRYWIEGESIDELLLEARSN